MMMQGILTIDLRDYKRHILLQTECTGIIDIDSTSLFNQRTELL